MVFIIMDETSSFKHFCRICKKGFGCGRALGGHMRAHGIGDESASIDDDEDVASDWEENNNKRMYSLRTNPNRLKSCKNCENCGKEFSSWKSFLEHGKCTSDDAESLMSSPGSVDGGRGCGGWSKRKRTLRAEMGNFDSEEEDLANCLMMLANATTGPFISEAEPEAEESCASASKEMNFVAPIACRVPIEKPKGLFECKACKKVFNSHQALGGHRASHKKVKGCFAAKLDHIDNINNPQIDEDHEVITHEEILPTKSTSTLRFDQGTSTPFATTSKKKSKVHECSICHRVFTSGQALGGHKRCHWVTSNSPDTSSLAKFHHRFQDQMDHHIHHKVPKLIDHNNSDQPLDLKLDLNLPATTELDLVRRNRANPYTQPRPGIEANRNIAINQHEVQVDNDKNNIDCSSSLQNADDEADSKVKLAKLNVGSSSSPWLQVGIGSTANVGSDH